MYLPRIDYRDAHVVKRLNLGDCLAQVYSRCKSTGRKEYEYVMIVLDKQRQLDPCLAVAAEKVIPENTNRDDYVLNVFPGSSSFSVNCAGEWSNLEAFTEKALEIVDRHFAVTELKASA